MARNTQQQLVEALRRLMLQKNLDSITVQELADEANVNKKTFYYHFHGIADLISWMYTVDFYNIIDARGVTPENWTEHMRLCCERIQRDRRYILAISRSKYAPVFQQSTMRMFDRAIEKYVDATLSIFSQKHGRTFRLSEAQLAYINSYHSMAIYGMLERWFNRGFQEPVEEFVAMSELLSNGSFLGALERLGNRQGGKV